MKLSVVFFVLLLVGKAQSSLAQCSSSDHFRRMYDHTFRTSSSLADGYDVHHVFLNLSMTNQAASISGSATTRATVVSDHLDTVVFELSDLLLIDSVIINGFRSAFFSDGVFRKVALPAPLHKLDTFALQVFYHGTQTSGDNFIGKGITHLVDDRWDIPVTYTLSEPYFARDWWPCKQSLTDKIDSADIWITVPAGLKAGSNGLLQQVTTLDDGYQRYEWKTRYPTDYYLISASIAPYAEYKRHMHFTNSADSMLLQDFVYDHPAVLPLYKNAIDSLPLLVNFFSDLWGRYPFYKEKYGHCLSPMGGGMEHQTMTTLRSYNFGLVVHELAHQWFGDYVTCKSWSDLWLNEGFATYCEYLASWHFKGETEAEQVLTQMQHRVYEQHEGSVYVTDTADIHRLFDGRLTYAKAGAIVHTLRYVVGNDSLFFPAIRTYLDTYAFGVAGTEDLKSIMASYAPHVNMDTFFRQWIYGEGYPHFHLRWNQVNGRVVAQLKQSTTVPGSVSFFEVPVGIKFYGRERDTVITVHPTDPEWSINFNWTDQIQHIEVDPDRWLLHSEAIEQDFNLIDPLMYPLPHPVIYPNPTVKSWRIVLTPENTEIRLLDISGRELWAQQAVGNVLELEALHLAKGVYLLELIFTNGQRQVHKLIKE